MTARAEERSRQIAIVLCRYREERDVSNMILAKNTWYGNGLQDEDDRKEYRNLDMHDRKEGSKGEYICPPTSALQE